MTLRRRQGRDVPDQERVLPVRRLVAWATLALAVAGLLAPSAFAAPVDNSLPEVIGTAKLGGRLQCASGSWSGGVSKFYFTWVRDGVDIEQDVRKETPEYYLQKADEGQEIWCIVTARGEGTEVSAESSNSVSFGVPVKKEKPESEKLPEVSGAGEVGKELKCSPGTWRGSPTPTLSYRWLRDEREIQGQTSSGYTVAVEDEGHTLKCKVIAVNEVGEAFAISANGVHVQGHPPEPVTGQPPVVEGVGSAGETLTCLPGGWNGTQPITFSYQWLLGGAEIAGATGQTLLVQASYEDESVACRVTAKNSVNEAKAVSAEFAIGEQTPEVITRPVISGKPEVGQILTCSQGEWKGAPEKFEFTWHRLNSGVEEEIGKREHDYTVVSADEGNPLYCTVKAENSEKKHGTAKSEAVVIPEAGKLAPKAKSLPLIEGVGAAGQTLTCRTEQNQWEGSTPISFEYQWVRDAGGGEVDIKEPEGTKSTYVVQGADEGESLTCRVTAKNAGGTGKAASVALEIPGKQPANTEAPSISPSGTAHVGETLTCLSGVWEGAPAPKYTYRWLRDGGETGVSGYVYKVVAADRGHTLSCVVTATNKYAASGVEVPSPGVYVPGGPPEPLEPGPAISGNVQVNEEVVCEEGHWNGAPLEPSFQWVLNGVKIPGATQENIRISTEYRGQLLACRVTETNKEGSASAESPAKRVPGVAPRNVVPPTITGVGSLGAQLTCEHGLWEGAPPPSFSYQWYRDSTPITGATGATYIIEPADQGHLLACVVTAANVENRSEAESANVVAVLKPKEPERGHTATVTPPTTEQIITLVRNAFVSQLPKAFAAMHLKSVRKSAGASLGFTSPRAGKLEIQWYITVKATHGKHRRITLAACTVVYAKPERRTMKIVLAKEGKRILKSVQHMKISAEAVFKVLSGPTVTWSDAFTLH
jgi:hypothetical protein